MDQSYEGFYARFDTVSKNEGSLLMGADNLVGDDFEVVFKSEDGRIVAWLKNKFGSEIGFLDADGSRRVQLAHGREQKIRAILSFVAYSDNPDPGMYWGQMAIFCFNPAYSEEMDAFVNRVAGKIADGIRPNIDLRSKSVEKIFEVQDWIPNDTVPLPKKETGMAVLKDHRSMSEKMIEQGRAGNRGCYAISIMFIVIVVLAIAYGIAHITGIL